MVELRVKNTTYAKSLATSIHAEMQKQDCVVLLCMGVAPVSISVKAVAIANGIAAPQGRVYTISPAFLVRDVDGRPMTVISMRITAKAL